MGFKDVFLFACVVGAVSAQTTYRVCVSSTQPNLCSMLSRDDSQATCSSVVSRVDCALRLANGQADLGYFNEEETLLLTQQQPDAHRVIATVRDVDRLEPYAFEAVAVVPSTHTNGLEGLRGGVYCHPGLDVADVRWSPRVLKNLEELAARTDRCPNVDTNGKTAEELEVENLNGFFSAACRPGTWSNNDTVDAALKSRFPSLCERCGPDSGCSRYTINMGVPVAGVRNENRHIQALECLRTNVNASTAVAYVAWQHVREFFNSRNPTDAPNFSVLCPNGTLAALTNQVLASTISPCAFVRQPWGAIVASTNNAASILNQLRVWWPAGANPNTNTWQSTLFTVVSGGANARVVFQDAPISVQNYTSPIRTISPAAATTSCLPARRWCTISTAEQLKCDWVRAAAYTLGIQPTIACQQRNSVIDCLSDTRDDQTDFISIPSNYGYLARQHFRLTPVKLVQNTPDDASRIAAFVKESSVTASNITRFENLRGKVACFPEFGGLAYVSFVRAGQERGILSSSECDYARTVGEFFGGACAPGAIDASHALSESSFNASVLCSACRPTVTVIGNENASTCAYDYNNNKYYGNNGSLACLTDPNTDVAFLNTRNISAPLGSVETQFRALCRNNSLAVSTGFKIDEGCLLAYVVDAEVVTRRNDPLYNSLNTLLDTLDNYFGYAAATGNQLINLEIFSPLNGANDLLFKDSTIDITEPTAASSHEAARNYIELFRHLQACTGTAPPIPGLANRSFYSIVTLLTMALLTRFVSFNASVLCSACRPTVTVIGNENASTCAYDYNNNKYYGNNGSLACLTDPNTDVAFLNTRNISAPLGSVETQFRALCRNNSLAISTGFKIDEGCLLAYVVDAEVVTRRNDPLYNSLNTLLDTLDNYFGYAAATGNQLINLEIFSPLNGANDLLFKDSTIDITEPTAASSHEAARNYIELFRHLQACTGTAPPIPGLANRSFYSIVTLLTMALLTRFVVY